MPKTKAASSRRTAARHALKFADDLIPCFWRRGACGKVSVGPPALRAAKEIAALVMSGHITRVKAARIDKLCSQYRVLFAITKDWDGRWVPAFIEPHFLTTMPHWAALTATPAVEAKYGARIIR